MSEPDQMALIAGALPFISLFVGLALTKLFDSRDRENEQAKSCDLAKLRPAYLEEKYAQGRRDRAVDRSQDS